MRRPAMTLLLALFFIAASVRAQHVQPSQALPSTGDPVCDPPFGGGNCSPPPGAHACLPIRTARRGPVRAELVEDGVPGDLSELHLVIRTANGAWILRRVGERGVGCGTSEMFSSEFRVVSLRIADVLGDPAPEVILVADHTSYGDDSGRQPISRSLAICSTGPAAPRCVRFGIGTDPVRYQRPDAILTGGQIVRVDLSGAP